MLCEGIIALWSTINAMLSWVYFSYNRIPTTGEPQLEQPCGSGRLHYTPALAYSAAASSWMVGVDSAPDWVGTAGICECRAHVSASKADRRPHHKKLPLPSCHCFLPPAGGSIGTAKNREQFSHKNDTEMSQYHEGVSFSLNHYWRKKKKDQGLTKQLVEKEKAPTSS